MFTRALTLALIASSLASAQRLKDLQPPSRVKPGDTIVIGLLGGFERWNDPSRSIRKVVLDLRQIPGVHAESVGNHNVASALHFIEHAAHAHPRVIVFGQSLGGSATVELARALHRRHMPVELTVQVDSVGLRDRVIPENVRAAVNYFQHSPLTIQGRSEIRAADPFYTYIIGNYERRYPMFDSTLVGPQASWARRRLGGGHARMEADPDLWAEIETLIRRTIGSHETVRK